MNALGIDIGGSGIKGALVDTREGQFVTDRERIATPESGKPSEVLNVVCQLINRFEDYDGPVGIGFPAVVVGGKPRTPFTAHHVEGWVGYPVAQHLHDQLGRAVTLLNDADAAGIAEMRFGNGRGKQGVVIVLTLGTGIGSSLFIDGHLVPNTEFGRFYLKGHKREVEQYAAGDVRTEEGLSWRKYAARLDKYLYEIDKLFSPRLIIIGGGVSKKHENFLPLLTVDAEVIPAALRNRAGIIGAATAAVEGWPH